MSNDNHDERGRFSSGGGGGDAVPKAVSRSPGEWKSKLDSFIKTGGSGRPLGSIPEAKVGGHSEAARGGKFNKT